MSIAVNADARVIDEQMSSAKRHVPGAIRLPRRLAEMAVREGISR